MKILLKPIVILASLLYSNLLIADDCNGTNQPQCPSIGLYWFGDNNNFIQATANQNDEFFDPTQKTIIYFHGRADSHIKNNQFETFNFSRRKSVFPDVNVADSWRRQGWNIGIFYWREYADSRQGNGIKPQDEVKNDRVRDIFVEAYEVAMANYTGPEVRFAGHSLGAQLTISAAQKIHEAGTQVNGSVPPNAIASRIILLDPFFGGTAASNKDILDKMPQIAVEYYQSSLLVTATNMARRSLKKKAAFQEVRPLYIINPVDNAKHQAAVFMYFDSIDSAAPAELNSTFGWMRPTGNVALNANTPLARVREMMGDKYYWSQVRGQRTKETCDDQYARYTFNILGLFDASRLFTSLTSLPFPSSCNPQPSSNIRVQDPLMDSLDFAGSVVGQIQHNINNTMQAVTQSPLGQVANAISNTVSNVANTVTAQISKLTSFNPFKFIGGFF